MAAHETVEKVARAIYEAGIPKGGRDYVAWDDLDSEGFYAQHDLAMKQARAAIAAMPEVAALVAERDRYRDALEYLAADVEAARVSGALNSPPPTEHERANLARARAALAQEKP
jgi:hypothetical protein